MRVIPLRLAIAGTVVLQLIALRCSVRKRRSPPAAEPSPPIICRCLSSASTGSPRP